MSIEIGKHPIKCNKCENVFINEDQLARSLVDGEPADVCPDCNTDEYLMDVTGVETKEVETSIRLALSEASKKQKQGLLLKTSSGTDIDKADTSKGDPETVYSLISCFGEYPSITEKQDIYAVEQLITNAVYDVYPEYF